MPRDNKRKWKVAAAKLTNVDSLHEGGRAKTYEFTDHARTSIVLFAVVNLANSALNLFKRSISHISTVTSQGSRVRIYRDLRRINVTRKL